MAINLNKTENKSINLTKSAPSLTKVKAVLWWDAPKAPVKYDLDVSGFILKSTPNGPKLISEKHFVFFNNETAIDKSVWKTEDQRGGGTEELFIDVTKLDSSVDEVSIVVTIHEAIERNQHFGEIAEAGIKILNADTNEELAFYDLDADYKNQISVQFGSLYKKNNEFTFQAIGQGYSDLTLGDFVEGYL
jgi:tellurium resistance protein TerD